WQIRKAVKPWLEDTSQPILFGCSGGADSLAMALALFAETNGGFAAITISSSALYIEYIGRNGDLLYSHAIEKV
ncbi:MAG: hypothetical protein ACO3EO_06110, partial [Candidatus Kapaibacteriota bacterium]